MRKQATAPGWARSARVIELIIDAELPQQKLMLRRELNLLSLGAFYKRAKAAGISATQLEGRNHDGDPKLPAAPTKVTQATCQRASSADSRSLAASAALAALRVNLAAKDAELATKTAELSAAQAEAADAARLRAELEAAKAEAAASNAAASAAMDVLSEKLSAKDAELATKVAELLDAKTEAAEAASLRAELQAAKADASRRRASADASTAAASEEQKLLLRDDIQSLKSGAFRKRAMAAGISGSQLQECAAEGAIARVTELIMAAELRGQAAVELPEGNCVSLHDPPRLWESGGSLNTAASVAMTDLREQLAAKDAKLATKVAELSAAQTRAAEAASLRAELQAAKAEAARLRESAEACNVAVSEDQKASLRKDIKLLKSGAFGKRAMAAGISAEELQDSAAEGAIARVTELILAAELRKKVTKAVKFAE